MTNIKDRLADFIITDAKDSTKGIDFSNLKNKTVLITGASGIVGTYFLAGLSGTKAKVYAVCQSKPEAYWKEITENINCTVLRGDLCNDAFVKKLPKADFIIHAAGYGQPGKFMIDPLKTIKLNTTLTLALLEKLKPKGKFLFLSSSEVYSGLTKSPFKESEVGTTNTDHPRACYIEAKCCGEAIISSARSKGIDAKSARLSLAYGPGTKKDDARVINSFIRRALTEGKIEMMDSGLALRTYCYVTDAVEIMWNILLSGKEATYNVGGTSTINIANLGREIGSILDVPVIIPKEKSKGEKQALSGAPLDVSLDLTKIKKEFGKKNFVSLEKGLKKTIEWQKGLYNM